MEMRGASEAGAGVGVGSDPFFLGLGGGAGAVFGAGAGGRSGTGVLVLLEGMLGLSFLDIGVANVKTSSPLSSTFGFRRFPGGPLPDAFAGGDSLFDPTVLR